MTVPVSCRVLSSAGAKYSVGQVIRLCRPPFLDERHARENNIRWELYNQSSSERTAWPAWYEVLWYGTISVSQFSFQPICATHLQPSPHTDSSPDAVKLLTWALGTKNHRYHTPQLQRSGSVRARKKSSDGRHAGWQAGSHDKVERGREAWSPKAAVWLKGSRRFHPTPLNANCIEVLSNDESFPPCCGVTQNAFSLYEALCSGLIGGDIGQTKLTGSKYLSHIP